MAKTRGRERPAVILNAEEESLSDGKPPMDSLVQSSESQPARLRLRERWELAAVLNFLHVFRPILQSKLKFPAEEIETALITPNDTLACLHILLLKGIPPVRKSSNEPDVWVKELCKKLDVWWSTVAEGGSPLPLSHGEVISKYKEIDPTVRLVILKVLCEIRLIQNDILTHINNELKDGRQLSTFRKDRIGGDENGTSYWYDGDSVIGHRLYREVSIIGHNQSLREKGHLAPPATGFQWETLATNLEEFREISDKLSSSEVVVESNVGKIVEKEILPVLEKIQKKKERTLKRLREKSMPQSGLCSSLRMMNTRTCRVRRPVSYTFDDFDKSINEALEVLKEDSNSEEKHEQENASDTEGSISDESQFIGTSNGSCDNYDDNNGKDGAVAGDNLGTSENESNGPGNGVKQNSQKRNGLTAVVGLRRSKRVAGTNGPGLIIRNNSDEEKQLRQRPPCDSNSEPLIISDSEDGNLSEDLIM